MPRAEKQWQYIQDGADKEALANLADYLLQSRGPLCQKSH